MISILMIILILFSSVLGSTSFAEDKKIVFADPGWDSVKLHNAIAGTIVKALYGYSFTEVPGSSTILHEALLKGEVDVHMEEWTDNLATYDVDLNAGNFRELGINFNDSYQGIYVPRYVIEGDSERGIKASAPDLKNIWDLKKYPEIFKDEENPTMGRMYGSIPGWEVDEIIYNKYKHYGLDENFIYFRPGSEAALTAAITSAYEKGEPIAGYYWEPTWLLGLYDMVLLDDKPYNADTVKQGKTTLPAVKVTVATSNKFYENEENKKVIAFLEKYRTSSALTSEGLAHIQETGDSYIETAKWFLVKHDELLDEWLDKEDAQKMRNYLSEEENEKKGNLIYDFPFKVPINLKAIDDSVRNFSVKHDAFFEVIREALKTLVTSIQTVLNFIPWFVLLIAVFLAGWKVSGKFLTGLLYTGFLFLIGMVGYWNLMNETLAIILASVLISLLIGFPIGIFLSTSDRGNSIIRPILDTMQTMPVFVYLIPALLFFGLGKAPAVIATTIYAVVPIIRLTNLGIRQIDEEIVEASKSFGSTTFQSLFKVQIPQALPTIMTGVNQTLMMAISMVVTTSMIGATGLGMEVLLGVNRVEIGRGLVSGTAVVIIAVVLDRLTQGLVNKNEVKTDVQ
ncbi:glycine betaine ABC transporter substrate-binding protein [Tissierella creatinophila]|nr:glycine betaine ABC transporter substrate-binding protein [Tissierella creatinophila]